MISGLERRATIHAALADPTRLAIVDELSVSDRSPKELGVRFELPTNLVAHHLDTLERVGLVERFVSAGDRRRRYVRLVRAPFGELRLPRSTARGRTVFVCSQNSARSQLAAALWSARTGLSATSAGTHPAERVHPRAVSAAERAGIDLHEAVPRRLGRTDDRDLVITVCDRAHEELDVDPLWWHWSIPDPVATDTDDAFDATIAELDARIGRLAPTDDPSPSDPS